MGAVIIVYSIVLYLSYCKIDSQIAMAELKTVIIQFNDVDHEILKIKVDSEYLSSPESFHALVSEILQEKLFESFHLEYLDRSGRFTRNFPSEPRSGIMQVLIVVENTVLRRRKDVLLITGKAFSISDGLTIGCRLLYAGELSDNTVGTGHSVWDGSVVLAKYLDLHPELVHMKHVLEVGSGTGVSGMAAALLGATSVLCTDLPAVLPNLHRNIDINFPDAAARTISAAALDWFDSGSAPSPPSPDGWSVVLAADVIWLEELVAPLVETLTSVCSEHSLLLLSFQMRTERTAKMFFSLMSQHFVVNKVPETDYHPDYTAPRISIYKAHLIR